MSDHQRLASSHYQKQKGSLSTVVLICNQFLGRQTKDITMSHSHIDFGNSHHLSFTNFFCSPCFHRKDSCNL